MKVRMNVTSLGSVGGVWSPREGDEIEVSDEVGALLCAKKIASPVVEDRSEKAVPAKKVEKRVRPKSE